MSDEPLSAAHRAPAPRTVHHINFIVHDLDAALQRYRAALGIGEFIEADLPQRSVRTARFLLGEVWIVLVQPLSDQGEPARFLREHGEGVFLISLGVDDLELASAAVRAAGARMRDPRPRHGLEDWRIMDLEADDFFGAPLQFTQLTANTNSK